MAAAFSLDRAGGESPRFPAASFTAAAGLSHRRGTDAARAGVQQARDNKAEPAVQLGSGTA
ncbi:hypothetical protein GCM10010269_16290 [Streptomyces humidus]|uniref:Uncharacterized protein n=1 Tax=Streptomyces humidus TaxID=52259 RepID=A0A918FSS0_9ACTN|nr:hypothetical protein GCM10010269_16290 [Streptomyces humidus]